MPTLRDEVATCARRYVLRAEELLSSINDPGFREQVDDVLRDTSLSASAVEKVLRGHGLDISSNAIRKYRARLSTRGVVT